ncbi:hypothetical protein OQH61_08335 [Helicobacter sp. MIT 21-1697]|uniref:hypothetical protein n=1 Tax=Helicobacter sp. MIT 21-1697 TaxID=2993733 RepID=UPI00224B7BDD|nr:hypothetical protein [Helicobacter sp. MIT 21-1697]MCX2717741.1 hypothetical protein [Helicobacter sp. MIT 21-1697]
MRYISIALVSVGLPIKCGLYENQTLIEEIISDELPLVALPRIFESLLPTPKQNPMYRDMKIESIYYANGPGSFTALKLTHIFLHTLAMVYDIKLFATSSFYFTSDCYIKAFGTTCFYCDCEGNISLAHNIMSKNTSFFLPKTLDTARFHTHTQPLYILPPV